uniref:Uncharacterized protein n=2 Tax=Tetranychus urticae TaxID=32264 RepID=T1KEI5_TETUR
MNTNGFNVERSSSSTRQGKTPKSSSSNGQFGKNGVDSNHGSTHWKGKQYMETNDDHHESTANQEVPKGDYLTDAEFQKARDWKGFVDDWERKAKDELADAINENMKIDSGKSENEDEYKGRYDGGHYQSRDHNDEHKNVNNKQIGSIKTGKADSDSKYGNTPTSWDWDKESNGAWTKKSDDGQKHDFGKFEKYHQKFADHEQANQGDELDEVTGQNEDKTENQQYGKKLGGWDKTGKSGDHHFQSGHKKETSHNNKFDANDSWKGWD